MKNSLKALFHPKSIAVIGASRHEDTPGKSVLKNIAAGGFEGEIYPVNPKAEQVLGMKAYASVKDIKSDIDLAFIAVPRDEVLPVMEACAAKKVKAAAIISAGFKEASKKGAELENKIAALAQEHGMTLLGPNCLGVINTHAGLNGTFAKQHPPKGHISFISQSGAVGVYSLEFALHSQINFASMASLGNKAVSNENDILEAFTEDENTKIIIAYLEELEEPSRFFELSEKLRKQSPGKPFIILKSGSSKSGKRAAESHTGALAESNEVLDDLFDQYGILRVDNLEELFEGARIFSSGQQLHGKRVCIVTNAGGPGIITADEAEKVGLEIPELSEKLQKQLSELVPDMAALKNPIDLIGDADAKRYEQVMHCLIESDEVDAVIALCTPQLMTDMEKIALKLSHLAEPAQKKGKMILAAFADFDPESKIAEIFAGKNLPYFRFGSNAVKALSLAAHYQDMKTRPGADPKKAHSVKADKESIEKLLQKANQRENKFLTEPECYSILEEYGLQIAAYKVTESMEEAEKAAEDLGYPLVAKVVSEDIIHKSEAEGVKTGITNKEQLKSAYEAILKKAAENGAEVKGILLQKMIEEGNELIIGVKHSDKHGHIIMFGLGGIFVEVLKDVKFRRLPIDKRQALPMVQGIRAQKFLEGTRGKQAVNKEIMADYLLRIAQLVADFPQIKEIDINPLFGLKNSALVADARLIVRDKKD